MKLSELTSDMDFELLQGDADVEFETLEYDSRAVKKGSVFICIEGFAADGHKYAASACENGAVAVICQKTPDNMPQNVTALKCDDTRKALAALSAKLYGYPSEKMNIIGVTGTNGKTTTTYLIKSALDDIGRKVGVIGTIENRIGDEVIPTERTTPESMELQKLFAQMAQKGCDDAVMEVSSHALDLKRVYGVSFDVGIFTNLTQDHLDYHKTMENYKKAKGALFGMCKTAVINTDDAAGEYMASQAAGKVITYGIDKKADLTAENISVEATGSSFTLSYDGKKYPVSLNTPGKFSIYNALAALGACLAMDMDLERAIAAIGKNPGVNGRFQTIKSKKGVSAIVDYAHTPDGLENILTAAREFAKGRIITVFGCGGDRDRTKRPIMGEIAARLSDYCVVTSDNPRTEEPSSILKDVEPGVKKTSTEYTMIVDRGEAIAFAINMAKSDDIVIVAGKGHENYQIFADKTIHFDDVEQVKKNFGEDLL